MKRIFLISLFMIVVSGTFSFGQKIKFSDSTNVWEMLRCSFDVNVTCQRVENARDTGRYWTDTVFNGKSYFRIHSSDLLNFYREDTINKKVFIRYYNTIFGTLDTVDEILYDYKWQLGDTVRYHQMGYMSTVAWVSNIDSTQISGMWYKVWHFYVTDSVSHPILANYSVIEGIGCTNGLTFPVNSLQAAPWWEISLQLICFSNSGVSPHLSNPVSTHGISGSVNFDNNFSCII